MKKLVKIENILILATIAFAAFTVGYFLGRNSSHTVKTTATDAVVTVERLEQAEDTLHAETVEQTEQTTRTETDSSKKTETGNRRGRININTATQEELETLPGIGEELAGRIVEYRRINGRFRQKSDICNVTGIGEKKYEAIKTLITVG